MSDDPNQRGPADRARINLNEEHEVRYWSEKFGASSERLKQAVARVGPMAHDVEIDLKER
jgi:hypothetical protein